MDTIVAGKRVGQKQQQVNQERGQAHRAWPMATTVFYRLPLIGGGASLRAALRSLPFLLWGAITTTCCVRGTNISLLGGGRGPQQSTEDSDQVGLGDETGSYSKSLP